MNHPRPPEDWSARGEIGSMAVLRCAVWLARTLGRPVTRVLVWIVCAGFAICHSPARAASKRYLVRVLGREPRERDVLRHFFTFGTTVLDRVYLLNDEAERFEITVHGEDIVTGILAQGGGCLLLGAHHGSFEVLRLVGRKRPDLRVSLAMYEDTGRKIGAALNAINPHLAPAIIGLGTPAAMIEIRDCLDRGGFVGMLADRTLATDTPIRVDFLGGNRYEIHFERLTAPVSPRPDLAETTRLVGQYVERLEHYCRLAPYNWFNFFDFWG
jgi:predicted LPLAT superfamily acyltransferase